MELAKVAATLLASATDPTPIASPQPSPKPGKPHPLRVTRTLGVWHVS
jgi:hypothetical protein